MRIHSLCTQVILVEEFSMLSARFLELLADVARIAKGSNATFGGMRIILEGDVDQLQVCLDCLDAQKQADLISAET